MTSLPALCAELRLRADGEVALVNSRDVAEAFEKQHQHVLRDVDAVLTRPDLDALWFRATDYLDAKGENRRSFDMTKQGFAVLVNGWTGDRAMTFRIRYVKAFDAMEVAISSSTPATHADLIQSVREIVAPLAVRFDGF
jgi:Rha family phage regulatory protein